MKEILRVKATKITERAIEVLKLPLPDYLPFEFADPNFGTEALLFFKHVFCFLYEFFPVLYACLVLNLIYFDSNLFFGRRGTSQTYTRARARTHTHTHTHTHTTQHTHTHR